MIHEDSEEPKHPFGHILLGFVLTIAALLGLTILAIQLAGPDYAKPIALGIVGLACLLVHPRVWWIWELPGIRPWRELAGDIPILVFYWVIGLAMIAYSVHGLMTLP